MTDSKPPRKQKQREVRSQPAPSGTERLKTVVRRLPPNLPEEIFWQSVQAWVTDDTVTWKSYHPGKQRTKRVGDREGVPSRAYIAFKNEMQVATFSRAYDGHVFRDKAGNESYAVVEYAPFQKVPTEKKKVDARHNTIDKDEDYLAFLETLTLKSESLSLDALLAASQPLPPPTTTPLLEALKAEKSAQKDKEAILRNHAHYKEAIVSAGSSKKEDGKKKMGVGVAASAMATATAAQVAKQGEAPPTTTAKRAKKGAVGAQKASTAQVQNVSGSQGKHTPGPTQATSSQPRHRPKDTHARSKGDTAASPLPPTATADNAPPTTTPAQRKHRPVIGLGRQFEAALSGAGVAVSAGSNASERKRRDKSGEVGGSVTGTGPPTSEGAGKTKPHREVVPSILQRPDVGGSDVQRPQSPRGTEGHAEGVGAARGKGSMRRGKGRRGHVG